MANLREISAVEPPATEKAKRPGGLNPESLDGWTSRDQAILIVGRPAIQMANLREISAVEPPVTEKAKRPGGLNPESLDGWTSRDQAIWSFSSPDVQPPKSPDR